MGGDHQDFGLRLPVFDQLDPLLHEPLLRAFAGLPHHQIDGRGGEEQLVRGPIDPLPAEIPAVQPDLDASAGIRYLDGLDLDAVGGGTAFFPGVAA